VAEITSRKNIALASTLFLPTFSIRKGGTVFAACIFVAISTVLCSNIILAAVVFTSFAFSSGYSS